MAPPLARILIVDDEFSVRDSLDHWFRKDGYDVQTAADATEAMAAMQSAAFDVVLLDVRLPGMDGMRLLEQIRRAAPATIVIMITAYASVDTAVRALKLGAADYVTKPINPEELSHVVAQALAQRRLREENLQLRGTIDEMAGESRNRRPEPADAKGPGADRSRRQDRGHGADPGRERDRQGAGGAGHPRRQQAPLRAAGGRQLRRSSREPAGKRALRPRKGGLHRRRRGRARARSKWPTAAPCSSTRWGPSTPRCRSICSASWKPARSSASAPTGRGRSIFAWSAPPTTTSSQAIQRRPLSRGLLLPHQRLHDRVAALAGPPRRYPRPGPALPRSLLPADGQPHYQISPEAMELLDEPRLAGQCPRAFQRHRTGHGGRPAAGDRARRSARAARAASARPGRNRWKRLKSNTLPPCWPARAAISPAPQRFSRSIGSRSTTKSRSTACGIDAHQISGQHD